MLRQMAVIVCTALALGAGELTGPAPEAGGFPEAEGEERVMENPGTEAAESPAPETAGFPETEREEPTVGKLRAGEFWGSEKGVSPAGTVPFEERGRMRLTYIGRRHSVSYADSPEKLPYELRTEEYGEKFFAERALLIVVETVNSGSVRIGIEAAVREDDTVTVTLSHEVPEYGTDDMATWMLWAEVERGLDGCEWRLANPALPSDLALE